jgi:hypothetical protein
MTCQSIKWERFTYGVYRAYAGDQLLGTAYCSPDVTWRIRCELKCNHPTKGVYGTLREAKNALEHEALKWLLEIH